MDWESLYGSCARYEERLREVEREHYAQKVWEGSHPHRRWWRAEWLKWVQDWISQGSSRFVRYSMHFGKLPVTLPDRKG